MNWYRYEAETLILKLYIQPGGRRSEIIGFMEDELKIKLAAPALENRANLALIKFLAQLFKVPQTNIVLKSGKKSRHKVVAINKTNVRPEDIFSPH